MFKFKYLLIVLTIFSFIACDKNSLDNEFQEELTCEIEELNKLDSPPAIELYRMMDYLNVSGIGLEIEFNSGIDRLVLNQAQFLKTDSTGFVIGVPLSKNDHYVGFIFYFKNTITSFIDYSWMSDLEKVYKNNIEPEKQLDALAILMLQNINRVYNNSVTELDSWLGESMNVESNDYLDLAYCFDQNPEGYEVENIKLTIDYRVGFRAQLPEEIELIESQILDVDYNVSQILSDVKWENLENLSLNSIELINKMNDQSIVFCNGDTFKNSINKVINELFEETHLFEPNELFGQVEKVIEKIHLMEGLQEIGFLNVDENTFNTYSPSELGYNGNQNLADISISELCQ